MTEAYLAEQRWFAGKGRDFTVEEVRTIARLSGQVTIELVEVAYAAGEPPRETYQMPVVTYDEPQDRLGHALVREDENGWTYDALHDRDAMAVLLQAFADGKADGVEVHVLGNHVPDTTAHSTFLSAEQSNSSVVFGEESILKVFRKVTSGHNPDIEIHRALTEAGDEHVAHLYGWLSDGDHDLAMLQQFLRTASDGWELAKNSARNLFVEGDLHADEVGGDFAGEAFRLGGAVASVHRVLADAFGTTPLDTGALGSAMSDRLLAAVDVVPDLEPYVEPLRSVFARVTRLDEAEPGLVAHRVHGDLHLGQTLRTSLAWKLVDFEGEPAKQLAERRLPDSPWRDVAGMVRSFHYAAAATARDLEAGLASQIAYRADEWVSHNVRAFLDGYTGERGAPITPAEQTLLDAYVADKAVYEAGYEARNRPGWLEIPLAALKELTEPT